MTPCPCGSGLGFTACCGPYIEGSLPAPTPEKLMRSRYCAYVLHNWQYLRDTWHPDRRSEHTLESLQSGPQPDWRRLEIIAASPTTRTATDKHPHGTVEFKAWYQHRGLLECLHEVSRFVQLEGKWYYQDGHIIPHSPLKPGRNAACPCNSGLKYKKCPD